jgi:hypothetical protein
MNACDAAGPGRKIEVEGKKYAPPAPVFDRYPIVSTEDVPRAGHMRRPEWWKDWEKAFFKSVQVMMALSSRG